MSVERESVARALGSAGCVYAESEADLLVAQFEGRELADAVARRASGSPLEQILGWAQFCGLRMIVEPGVFVPRTRTELLVEQAVSFAPTVVLDVCCGSGAVGTAVASMLGGVELHACDVDPAAVRCAARNVEPVGGHVYRGDLYDALPQQLRKSVDVIVANAPYVPTDAIASMPTEARDHEPRVALDGGSDGLDVQRRIVAGAREWLTSDGRLLVETSERQADRTAQIFRAAGFEPHIVHSDDIDGTVVVGEHS